MQKINLESIFKNAREIAEEISKTKNPLQYIFQFSLIIIFSGAIYGFTMGVPHSWQQIISSSIKVPMLYILTLSVTIPTLHFIGLFLGSKISFLQSISVLLLGIAVNSVLLLGFSTISIFFWYTGSSYRFLLFMHVLFFAISGFAGLISIYRSFNILSNSETQENKKGNSSLLQAWMLLYMFVGTQMAFVLSPFVGKETQFMVFHHPNSNFYSYLFDTFFQKFDGLIKSDKAKEKAYDSALLTITSLKNKDFQTIAQQIDPKDGLTIIPKSKPSFGGEFSNIVFSASSFKDAADYNKKMVISKTYDSEEKKYKKTEVPFLEIYSRFLYDQDYESSFHNANYNKFTVGLINKDTLIQTFKNSIFVEIVIQDNQTKWKAIRLVYKNSYDNNSNLLPLVGIIHDESNN